MATNDVVRDNVREFEIGDKTYELEASLGTGIIYANEFRGKLSEPYKGNLADDVLEVFRRNQPTLTTTAKTDEDGNVVKGEDGIPVFQADGVEVKYDNPDYIGVDTEALIRIAWAMARAAGSTKKTFAKFFDEVIHQPAGLFEEASMYETIVLELGNGIIFRRPTGRGGAEQPDEKEE